MGLPVARWGVVLRACRPARVDSNPRGPCAAAPRPHTVPARSALSAASPTACALGVLAGMDADWSAAPNVSLPEPWASTPWQARLMTAPIAAAALTAKSVLLARRLSRQLSGPISAE